MSNTVVNAVRDIIASKGNKRSLTTAATVVLGILQFFPVTAPFVPWLLQGLALFGVGALGQAALRGTLVNPVDIDPKTLDLKTLDLR